MNQPQKNAPRPLSYYAQGGIYGAMTVGALGVIALFGPNAYLVLPLKYGIRVASIGILGTFALFELPRFGKKTPAVLLFLGTFVELVWNALYTVRCPASLYVSLYSNSWWPLLLAGWMIGLALSLLILRPGFHFNVTVPLYIGWTAVFFALGLPVVNGYCPGSVINLGNYAYELVDGVFTYSMVYFTVRPRETP